MKPKILLTNDDGIHAPGIKSLFRSLKAANFAELAIIAPSLERLGVGVGITWDRPMLIQEFAWEDETPAWCVDGTPADCVKMGIRTILKQKPDLIIAGINAGSNAGRNVLHSGTVGAVIEGVLRGIPGIAFSCEDVHDPNFHVAEKYVVECVQYLLKHPLQKGSFLNINFPHCAREEVKGFRLTKQGQGRWAEDPFLHLETESGPSYWLGGKPEELDEGPDCDISLLREGYMTAVPIHVHQLTDHHELEKRKENFELHFQSEKEL